jgi:RNA polymerase sigma-70 factor (ECF subfamily)
MRPHSDRRVDDLLDAVEELPWDMREVVLLREVEGLTYLEIASTVGIPIGTVKSRLACARARLRAGQPPNPGKQLN